METKKTQKRKLSVEDQEQKWGDMGHREEPQEEYEQDL